MGAAAVFVVLGFLGLFRILPIDLARAQVNPAQVAAPAVPNYYLMSNQGQAPALVLDLDHATVKANLDAIALATPRTKILVKNDELTTYLTRSAIFGFADLTSVYIEPLGQRVRIFVFARSAVGGYDFSVNKRRIQGWINALVGPLDGATEFSQTNLDGTFR
ncbi:MAG: DUF1499 domain-containing protein [Paracoccaceae bacterium]